MLRGPYLYPAVYAHVRADGKTAAPIEHQILCQETVFADGDPTTRSGLETMVYRGAAPDRCSPSAARKHSRGVNRNE